MVKEFKLPDIGEGIHEGEVVRWLVAAGDVVAEDQPIAEVMTDKATVELTSPFAGTVRELGAQEGETILVGATLIVIDDGEDDAGGGPDAGAAAPAPSAKPAQREAPAAAPSQAAVAAAQGGGPVLAAPATRRLARDLGVELARVPGSGPKGRITRTDVELAASADSADSAGAAPPAAAPRPAATALPAAPEPAPPARVPMTEDRRIPLRGLRRKIAQHMTRSKQTAAHFTYVEEVDVSDLVRLRRESKPIALERGVRLTYLPYIMKAMLVGLRRHPALNATMDDERSEIVQHHEYNMGIAVDTPAGLVVPVVKGVDRHSILDLARELERVATAARAGKSSLEDLRGGTITITNAGNIGGLLATPIINYPEVAIVGVHKIARRPVVRGDRIEIGEIMYLSISIDHRVVDGAEGARFMNEVKRVLESPGLLLLEG